MVQPVWSSLSSLNRNFLQKTDFGMNEDIDVYCYACDDARTDPHLAKHLATFGIEVASQKKTEKSMTELVRFSTLPDYLPRFELIDDGQECTASGTEHEL